QKSNTDIAIDLDMPVRVVQRVLQTWDEIGTVLKEPQKVGQAPLLSTSQVTLLLTLLDQYAIYLDKLQDELQWRYDVSVSLATIWRSLKRLGITSKKVSRHSE
ncbi:hypothetical protein JB92DRAFT_2777561, partial [Gautieria morchelliformis]